MSSMRTQSVQLTCLSESLIAVPSGERSEILWHCLGFVPASESQEFEVIGPIRATFSTCWEELFEQPVPIVKLRESLVAGLVAEDLVLLTDIDQANTAVELQSLLSRLLLRLQRVCKGRNDLQLQLFGVSEDSLKPLTDMACQDVPGVVNDLSELVLAGCKFSTIYADPPWPYENEVTRGAAVRHYPTMSVEEMCSEPVVELAQKNAHLHLWTTNGFFHEALAVMDAWGFQYKSCLVWIKPDFGLGNYWRVAHEFLLLGVRGSLPFRDRRQRSWVLANRTIHSRKPAVVRLLIEKVSPGPYLELYGREEIPDSPWTVYGNEVERRLL